MRLSRRDVTGKYPVKKYDESCTEWNYDVN
jgi:hypothetical protein